MRKISFDEFKNMNLDYAPLFMKHVELGNIQMVEYYNFSDLKKLARMNRISYDPQNKLFGIRMTNKPLTEDVLYG